MKTIKILFATLALAITVTSCQKTNKLDPSTENHPESITTSTSTQARVPFLQVSAFTQCNLGTGTTVITGGLKANFIYMYGSTTACNIQMFVSKDGGLTYGSGKSCYSCDPLTASAIYNIGGPGNYIVYFKSPYQESPKYNVSIVDEHQ